MDLMQHLFADLQGQPLAQQLLEAALDQDRLAPAYLFSGPDGVGRRLAAQRFLEGLLGGGSDAASVAAWTNAITLTCCGWSPPTAIRDG